MKKFISMILVVAVCVSMAACGSSEKENVTGESENMVANGDYFEWSQINETEIVGYTEEGLKQTELIIPAECTSVQGLDENTTVKYISFENPNTEVSGDTFCRCTNLETVELPGNLEVIEDYMFYDCIGLKQITIPEGVVEIGDNAFLNCEALETVILNNNLEVVGRKAFNNCTSLKSIIIPDSVTTIESSAFKECSSLNEVVFGAGLKTIGESAFQSCTSLKEIELQEGVTDIEIWTFAYCDALEDIYLPESIKMAELSALAQNHNVNVHVVKGSYMDGRLDEMMGAEFYQKKYQ